MKVQKVYEVCDENQQVQMLVYFPTKMKVLNSKLSKLVLGNFQSRCMLWRLGCGRRKETYRTKS